MSILQRKVLMTAAAASGAGTSYATDVTPFLVGTSVIGRITTDDFNGTVTIQTSEDDTAWTTVATVVCDADDKTVSVDVALAQHVRANVTAYTAGTVSVQLEA